MYALVSVFDLMDQEDGGRGKRNRCRLLLLASGLERNEGVEVGGGRLSFGRDGFSFAFFSIET